MTTVATPGCEITPTLVVEDDDQPAETPRDCGTAELAVLLAVGGNPNCP